MGQYFTSLERRSYYSALFHSVVCQCFSSFDLVILLFKALTMFLMNSKMYTPSTKFTIIVRTHIQLEPGNIQKMNGIITNKKIAWIENGMYEKGSTMQKREAERSDSEKGKGEREQPTEATNTKYNFVENITDFDINSMGHLCCLAYVCRDGRILCFSGFTFSSGPFKMM